MFLDSCSNTIYYEYMMQSEHGADRVFAKVIKQLLMPVPLSFFHHRLPSIYQNANQTRPCLCLQSSTAEPHVCSSSLPRPHQSKLLKYMHMCENPLVSVSTFESKLHHCRFDESCCGALPLMLRDYRKGKRLQICCCSARDGTEILKCLGGLPMGASLLLVCVLVYKVTR